MLTSRRALWRWALATVVFVYILAAVAVAMVVPFGAAADPRVTPPDESAHWLFVRDLARTGRLPVFAGDPGYEAHQPPLFYASAVWSYWLLGDAGLRVARVWSALFGATTLVAAWWASGYLLGDRPWARVAAVAALGLLPGRVFITASVSNDALAECCAAFTLWLSLRAMARGLHSRDALALGVSLGLALLAKTTGLMLAVVVVPALLLEPSWREAGLRRLVRNGLLVVGVVTALWGWWVVRNLLLYGEPLATRIFQSVFLQTRATPEFFLSRGVSWSGYWLTVAVQTWMSLWGVFGQATVYMSGTYYLVGTGLAVLSGLGWLCHAQRARRREIQPQMRRAWLVGLSLLLLTVALFVHFNTVFYQAQARYFLVASVVLAAVLGGGFCGLGPTRWEAMAAIGLATVLGVMTTWAIIAHVTGCYSLTPPFL